MINTTGGRFGGFGFYLLKGKALFVWNLPVRWVAPAALSPVRHTLEFDLKYDGLGFATLAFNNISGTGVVEVDGQTAATQTMEHTIPILLPLDESFDIGADTLTGVDDDDYQAPFKFTGKIGSNII